jgi:hypothetical protein
MRASVLRMMAGLGLISATIWAADDKSKIYADAERSAKDLIYYYEDFRKLDIDQIKRILTAMSEADNKERKDVRDRINREARDRVNSEFSKVEQRRTEALKLLDAVLKEPELRDKFSDTYRLQNEVNDKFQKISKMKDNLEPIAVYLDKTGTELEQSRHGGCAVYEFDVGSSKIDCMRPPCDLIEFKPDNSHGIGEGTGQIKTQRQALLQNASLRNDLNNKDSRFKECKDFRMTIEAYKLSTDINEDGSVKIGSVSWASYPVNP